MTDDPRPVVRALVGYALPGEEWRVSEHVLELADAAVLVDMGWNVMVDPADEAMLARWEQLQRPRRAFSSW